MTKQRVTVYLIQRKRPTKSGVVPYFYLSWRDPGGRQRMESLGRCSKMSKAQAKAARAEKEEAANGEGIPDKRGSMTLGAFRPFYRENRARGNAPKARRTSKRYMKLSEGTLAEHDMVLRYLVQHFGERFRLDDLDELAAEGWHDALADGKLGGARKGGHHKPGLAENTLRSKVRSVKAVFGWAKAHEVIRRNPFADWAGTGFAGIRPPYVSLDVFRAVCEQAPTHYRAFFGLCRLAGLRKSEALSLPWSGSVVTASGSPVQVGIDWSRKAIRVLADKTDSADRVTSAYRAVPIVAELMPILSAAFEEAPDGAERVAHPLSANNLPRALARYCKAAGVAVWRKPHQALRTSREDDWKERGVAEPTYCEWLGHSPDVSRKHYVSSTPTEFAEATGGAA